MKINLLDLSQPLLDPLAELGLLLLVNDGPDVTEGLHSLGLIQLVEQKVHHMVEGLGVGELEGVSVKLHTVLDSHGGRVKAQKTQVVEKQLVVVQGREIFTLWDPHGKC